MLFCGEQLGETTCVKVCLPKTRFFENSSKMLKQCSDKNANILSSKDHPNRKRLVFESFSDAFVVPKVEPHR